MKRIFDKRWHTAHRPIDRGALLMTGALILTITVLSLFPNDALPKIQGSDKLHHFIAYCSAILPVAIARRRLAIWLAPVIIAYSGLIELIQPYSNRYAEWADLGANSLGVALGLIIGRLIGPAVMRRLPEAWR
ncbi:MAG: hypothetical protein RL336_621 [Pseudomonadota bacterium]